MRIAYVYDAVYPWETGGVQKRVWELARRLAHDHDVTWFGLKYWEGPNTITREGVTVKGVAPRQEMYVDGRRSITEALSFTRGLGAPMLGSEFDIIDCQEFPYFPCIPSKLNSLVNQSTLVLTWHEVWHDYWYEYLGWKGVCGKAVERLTARLPDQHVAVSDRTRTELSTLGVSDACLLPNGISMDAIESVPTAAEPVDVLFAGRLIKEKNVDLLIRAIDVLSATVPDIQGVIVGEGPERIPLKNLVRRLGLETNVEFVDFHDSHDVIISKMKSSEVFVLPSRREGFGMTVLEALACGTPIVTITHPNNAATELVDDERTGIICEPTPEAIADGIKRARTLSREDCVASAEPYDWEEIATRTESLYREVA